MEVLKITTKIDESGCLNLSIPTQLVGGEVNIIIVMNPVTSSEKSQVKYDFSDLAGQLTWKGDAIAIQRKIRDEW